MKGLDLVISFDDTGSMYSIRATVRQRAIELVKSVFTEAPNSRIGIVIHNDYCDDRWCIRSLDLTADQGAIIRFISEDGEAGGEGNFACYELSLDVISKMSWRQEKRAAVLIGDEQPHEVGYYTYPRYINSYGKLQYSRNNLAPVTCKINWVDAMMACINQNIKFYPVQCLNNRHANFFYDRLATASQSVKLNLLQFQYITTYLLAIFHHENGTLQTFEDSEDRFKSNYNLSSMFDTLFGRASQAVTKRLVNVNNIVDYQSMVVDKHDIAIKAFVETNGIKFKKGLGYYEFGTKAEDVQDYKQIVLRDRETDEVIIDQAKARQLLGLPATGTVSLAPTRCRDVLKKYKVFIQSTSVNRKLKENTEFLYAIDNAS